MPTEKERGSVDFEKDPQRCQICWEKYGSATRSLHLVYAGDEEFRVCHSCKEDLIRGVRMYVDGLRKLSGNPPMIYKDTRLNSRESFAKISSEDK